MSLFNELMKKIKCEYILGVSIEIEDMGSDIKNRYEEVEKIDNKFDNDNLIYIINIYLNKSMHSSDIDTIIFDYIDFLRYNNGLFYNLNENDKGFCYEMITFREDMKGFSCKCNIELLSCPDVK